MIPVTTLIEHVYQAVEDHEQWAALLDALCEGTPLVGAAVGYQPSLHDPLITGMVRGVDDVDVERLYAEVLADNPFSAFGLRLPVGALVGRDRDVLPRRVFVETPYFRWLQSVGADQLLIAVERGEDDSMVHVACYVREGEEVLDALLDTLRVLLPHVSRALALSRTIARLRTIARGSIEVMDRAHFGCILLHHDRSIAWRNEYAEAILLRGDALVEEEGRVVPAHTADRARFARRLDAALRREAPDQEPGREAGCRLRKSEGAEASGYVDVLISPLSPFGHPLVGGHGGALLMLADPDYLDEGISERLEHLYDLTPAEAEATQWLLAGYSIDSIASLFGKSPHTVRHQIKRVMKKCHVSSQAQLVGLIHRGVACLQ